LNDEKLWLKVAFFQLVVEWHDPQFVPKLPPWLSSLAWHAKQVAGVPLKTPFLWQLPQDTLTCAPVNLNAAKLWLKFAFFQLVVEWHIPQFVPKLPPCLSAPAWQSIQLLGVPLKTPFLWQFPQDTLTCAPVNLNDERLWSNVAGFQAVVLWHNAQFAPNLPLWLSSFAWHEMQAVGVPANLPFWWHCVHSTLR
jgi:hypothetical protein